LRKENSDEASCDKRRGDIGGGGKVVIHLQGGRKRKAMYRGRSSFMKSRTGLALRCPLQHLLSEKKWLRSQRHSISHAFLRLSLPGHLKKTQEVGLLSAAARGNPTNGRRPGPQPSLGKTPLHRRSPPGKKIGRTGLRSELLMRPNARLRHTAPCSSSQPGLPWKQKLDRIRTCRVDGQAVDPAEK
jgi:hypothetical protein